MYTQPPLGGCVLKLYMNSNEHKHAYPAAFRRLCVETAIFSYCRFAVIPAAFRRLCVETI